MVLEITPTFFECFVCMVCCTIFRKNTYAHTHTSTLTHNTINKYLHYLVSLKVFANVVRIAKYWDGEENEGNTTIKQLYRS